jgi:hypothetical protein
VATAVRRSFEMRSAMVWAWPSAVKRFVVKTVSDCMDDKTPSAAASTTDSIIVAMIISMSVKPDSEPDRTRARRWPVN